MLEGQFAWQTGGTNRAKEQSSLYGSYRGRRNITTFDFDSHSCTTKSKNCHAHKAMNRVYELNVGKTKPLITVRQ